MSHYKANDSAKRSKGKEGNNSSAASAPSSAASAANYDLVDGASADIAKAKVYVIVHDGQNMLVGNGGTVLRPKGVDTEVVARTGSHLFGGTIDTKDFVGSNKAPPVRQQNPRKKEEDNRPTPDQLVYLQHRSDDVPDLRFGPCPSPVIRAAVREFKEEAGFALANPPTPANCVVRLSSGRTEVYGIVHQVEDVNSLLAQHAEAKKTAAQSGQGSASAAPVSLKDSPFDSLSVVRLDEAATHAGFNKKDGTDWFSQIVVRAQANESLPSHVSAAAAASSTSPATATSSPAVSTSAAAEKKE